MNTSALPPAFLSEIQNNFSSPSTTQLKATARHAFQFFQHHVQPITPLNQRTVALPIYNDFKNKQEAQTFIDAFNNELLPHLSTLHLTTSNPSNHDKLQKLAQAYELFIAEAAIVPSQKLKNLRTHGLEAALYKTRPSLPYLLLQYIITSIIYYLLLPLEFLSRLLIKT